MRVYVCGCGCGCECGCVLLACMHVTHHSVIDHVAFFALGDLENLFLEVVCAVVNDMISAQRFHVFRLYVSACE